MSKSVLGTTGMRRRTVGRMASALALACTTFLIVIGAGAAPAGAHHAVMTGDSACVIPGTGKVQVDWTTRSWGSTADDQFVNTSMSTGYAIRPTLGDGPLTFPGVDADGSPNDYAISGTTSHSSTFIVDAEAGDTIHLVPRANVKWGAAQDKAEAGTYRGYAASIQVPDTPCAPSGIIVTFECTSVSVTSEKDLSNIVLVFTDGTTQRFEGLKGTRGTFAGTGANLGKELETVYVKSGPNFSGDGPGYGERFDAPAGNCAPTPVNCPAGTMTPVKDVPVFDVKDCIGIPCPNGQQPMPNTTPADTDNNRLNDNCATPTVPDVTIPTCPDGSMLPTVDRNGDGVVNAVDCNEVLPVVVTPPPTPNTPAIPAIPAQPSTPGTPATPATPARPAPSVLPTVVTPDVVPVVTPAAAPTQADNAVLGAQVQRAPLARTGSSSTGLAAFGALLLALGASSTLLGRRTART